MRAFLIMVALLAVLAAGGFGYLLVVAEQLQPGEESRSIELDVQLPR